MLGYGEDDLTGGLDHGFLFLGLPDGCEAPEIRLGHAGVPHHSDDVVFRCKNGQSLAVQYTSAPISQDGQHVGTVVAFNDNTARKQHDIGLARWEHIFSHSGWGIAVSKIESEQLELLNPAFARMHEYSPEELIGCSLHDVSAEECRSELAYNLDLTEEIGHHVWESWHVRKDGTRFPVQIDADAVKDARGKVLYRVFNVQDITARRQSEDILRESVARLRAQTQGMLGSWGLNMRSQTLELSAETYRIFGLVPGTPLSYLALLKCIHPRDRAYVIEAWRSMLEGEPYEVQHRLLVEGQVKWVRERVELQYDGDGQLLRAMGTTQDITEPGEHELIRSRQNLRDLAAHHEKIREEERTRIAREIHDELGQYLTALRMDTAMLNIRFGSGNTELENHVAGMKGTIDTTIGVVRNLAASLRPGVLDMGLVSAAEWLLSGFEERTHVRCHLHAPQEHLDVGDERGTAAFRILQESLTNITRYADAREVFVRIELVNEVLQMDIRDDGIGFDKTEVQGRKTFGLMGIRERALQFGGESRIESALGAGTTLRIRIPCRREVVDDPHSHGR